MLKYIVLLTNKKYILRRFYENTFCLTFIHYFLMRIRVLFIILFHTLVMHGYAQELSIDNEFSKCEKLVTKKKFADAKKCFEELIPFHPNDIKLLIRLAEISYELKETEAMKMYINRAIDMNAKDAYDPLMYLSQKMSFRKDKTSAVYILDKLGNNIADPQQKEKVTTLKNSYLLQRYELNTPHYNVQFENMGKVINSNESEYFPTFSLDGETMVFTRRVKGLNEDFFISQKDSCGKWSEAENLGYPPNTSLPEGGACLSADGNYLFFTRCDIRSQNGIEGGGCDLVFCYKEEKDGKKVWSSPQYFKYTINTTGYEGHASLSSDNKDLYFVSERADGFGGKDIYVSHFVNGLWSVPENLGSTINTSGDETAPYIHPDNESLYFASDGHPTLGKSDLFLTRKISNKEWQKPINLGSPINSSQFDGSIYVNAKGTKGYAASERPGGFGGLDIYVFDLYSGIKPTSTLCVKGKILDKKTQDLKKNQLMQFYTYPSMEPISELKSNKGDASYIQALHIGQQYLVQVERNGYRPFYKLLDLRKDTFSENYFANIRLREPGISDTLFRKNFGLDSLLQINENDSLDLTAITKYWQEWISDSADVKIRIRSYYYAGTGETDTLLPMYMDEAAKRIERVKQIWKKAEIPSQHIEYVLEPFLYRDEYDEYYRMYIEIVENY